LLPAVVFSIYEIATLNQSERMIEKIYNNQLDALLFSVNQYSEDVAGRLQFKLNTLSEENNHLVTDTKLTAFVKENSYVKKIVLVDSSLKSSDQTINAILQYNKEKLSKLYIFLKEKYNRIEPIEHEGSTFLFFVLDKSTANTICGVEIDSDRFIRDILTPKILSIAKDEFSVYVFSNEKIYDFNSQGNSNPRELSQQRKLWLLPSFSLAIKLRGETIENLVSQRTQINLIVILVLISVLIIGTWFVYRNIKREIELAQIKSEFVSNVSHELRTPLSLISMFAETLEMDRVPSKEKKQEYYTIISQEAFRLSNIVNKILSFSKMEAGKRTYNFKLLDLNEVVEQVFDSYKFHLQNNGFEFVLRTQQLPLKINADSEAIAEAIINLLDNAIKYSKDKKYVVLSTGEEKNFIFAEVMDCGIGIAKEDQKKIFEKFYRVKSGLVHNTKGTGLGLPLVKQIMQAHKGEVSLISEPKKGSTFRLKFIK
jgi:two-component system phosphate regulon sensor histidine kinase PhoR